ncbi:hypothetical protein CK203_007483 [Vitis vinifera]|uniref:Retrovirus-related Pol polyprotein from transposon RE1 n=1 Tax=Vitis vinifera TaxID=29760 RepID=A0A438G1C5_VITVI|nr:hypothetical protein CK203_007483 [Vitis vinifera]
MIGAQYNAKVRVLRSNNGGEYQSSNLQKEKQSHPAAYLINRVPSSSIDFQTPLQALTNVELPQPSQIYLFVFLVAWHLGSTMRKFRLSIMIIISLRVMNLDNLKLVNQEAGELDMSGATLEPSNAFTEIPNQLSSAEGVLNLEPDSFIKQLPHRHNRVIPNSVQEALVDPRWKAAMNEEMKSLQKNETWELVECPP